MIFSMYCPRCEMLSEEEEGKIEVDAEMTNAGYAGGFWGSPEPDEIMLEIVKGCEVCGLAEASINDSRTAPDYAGDLWAVIRERAYEELGDYWQEDDREYDADVA